MNLNKISLSLIGLLLLFAIFCSVNIGMSWDEPQRHWQGAIRADYLKSLSFGKFQFKPGGWSEIEPGLYDTFSFFVWKRLIYDGGFASFVCPNELGSVFYLCVKLVHRA